MAVSNSPPPAVPEFVISNINAVEPAKLLRIPLSLGTHMTFGLLDTGSGISILSSEMFNLIKNEKISKSLPLDNIKISTASGDPMSTKAKVESSFKLSNVDKMKHPFYIVQEMTEDVILGLDFITAKGITYKGEDRTFCYTKYGTTRTHMVANIKVQNGFSDEKLDKEIKPNIGNGPGDFKTQIECLLKKTKDYSRKACQN